MQETRDFPVSIEAIRQDMLAGDADVLDAKTVFSYINALKLISVMDNMRYDIQSAFKNSYMDDWNKILR